MNTYQDHYKGYWNPNTQKMESRLVWSWKSHTAQRLTWAHGPDRALAILLGQDEKTNADIESWRNLGVKK